MLTDAATRLAIETDMGSVTHLSIAAAPDFQERFVRNLALCG